MNTKGSDIFAVLVGINNYGGGKDLQGCINDVQTVRGLLEKQIHVPSENIKTLMAPTGHPSHPSGEPPTRDNVLSSIDAASEKAIQNGPGSLLFFHYSGHGSRTPTKRRDLNKGAYDEAICTLKGHILDYEISDRLDTFAKKGLVVLMVLDCCHAGGADRMDDNGAVRSLTPHNQPKLQEPVVSAVEDGARNSEVVQTWFYRGRHHNLLAACRPHELARERFDDKNHKIGILTYFFVKAVEALSTSADLVTYDALASYIGSLCANQQSLQHPMLLGDRNRLVFGTQHDQRVADSLQANVTDKWSQIGSQRIKLDKGASSQVELGDYFYLYAPNQRRFGALNAGAQHGAEAKVVKVENSTVIAEVLPNSGGNGSHIEIGWFARLFRHANLPFVHFHLQSNHDEGRVAQLRTQWDKLVSSPSPPLVNLNFHYSSSDAIITDHVPLLHVKLSAHGTGLQFFDSSNEVMDHIPHLQLGDSDIAKKLAYLLHRLCSYQSLIKLSPKRNTMKRPSYNFQVEKDDWEGGRDESSGPIYEIMFTNNSQDIIYISILSLSPIYGVSQIFPAENAYSFAVGPQDSIPRFLLRITVPNLLKADSKNPDFRMRERYKLLITSQQADFSHYIQDGLVDWKTWRPDSYGRDSTPISRDADDFWVDYKEIEIPRDEFKDAIDKQPFDDVNDNSPNGNDHNNDTNPSSHNGNHTNGTNHNSNGANGANGHDNGSNGNSHDSGGHVKPSAPSIVGFGWASSRPSGWESD